MGSVAETEDTPSLKPGGRYPRTGVRAACLGWLARHGLLRVGGRAVALVEAGRSAAGSWRLAAGSAAGMPGGSGHAGRQVSPRDGHSGPVCAGRGFSPRGIRLAGDAGSPARV